MTLLVLVKIRREGCEGDYITTFASWPGRSVLLEQFGVFSGHFAANVWISFPDGCVSVSISRPTPPVQDLTNDARYISRYVVGTY